MALKIRIPYWATKGVTIKVNGKTEKVTAAPSSYVELKRRWKQGDKVEVSLPMSLHTSPLPDDPTIQAANVWAAGAGCAAGQGRAEGRDIYGPNAPHMRHETPIAMPQVVAEDIHSVQWVAPVAGEKLRFHTAGQAQGTNLIPLYQLMDERYSVYWKVNAKTV